MPAEAAPLPPLNDEFRLDAGQVSAFQRDGHILLGGVATTEEVALFRPLILAARDRQGPAVTPLDQRDTYGKAFLKGMNLWGGMRACAASFCRDASAKSQPPFWACAACVFITTRRC